MKVYFAASITGGRENQEMYFEIVDFLKKKGFLVLTEHVSYKSISSYGETNLSSEEIFTRDVNWIKECDILIADVTTPSLGVGYEIGFAESLNKKIICLYKEGSEKKLSSMISGNKKNIVRNYKNKDELLRQLDILLK